MDRDIIEDVKIDKFQLEKECAEHSELYRYWSKPTAEKKKIRDDLKIELKRLEGEIELDVRKGAVDIGVKITEGSVKAYINSCSKIVDKRKELAFAEFEVNKTVGDEESMKQRKAMINDLVQLYTKEYYAEPGNSTNIRDQINQNLKRKEK
jgi:hypothetical protein